MKQLVSLIYWLESAILKCDRHDKVAASCSSYKIDGCIRSSFFFWNGWMWSQKRSRSEKWPSLLYNEVQWCIKSSYANPQHRKVCQSLGWTLSFHLDKTCLVRYLNFFECLKTQGVLTPSSSSPVNYDLVSQAHKFNSYLQHNPKAWSWIWVKKRERPFCIRRRRRRLDPKTNYFKWL